IFDNVLGNLEFTDEDVRDHWRGTLLSEPQPLTSLLAEKLEEDEETGALATLSSQFLAAIDENPANDNLAQDFSESLFAAHTEFGADVRRKVGGIERMLLGADGGHVFARAASPLRLTALGRAASVSGFSPDSVTRILDTISDVDLSATAIEILTNLLLDLSDL